MGSYFSECINSGHFAVLNFKLNFNTWAVLVSWCSRLGATHDLKRVAHVGSQKKLSRSYFKHGENLDPNHFRNNILALQRCPLSESSLLINTRFDTMSNKVSVPSGVRFSPEPILARCTCHFSLNTEWHQAVLVLVKFLTCSVVGCHG